MAGSVAELQSLAACITGPEDPAEYWLWLPFFRTTSRAVLTDLSLEPWLDHRGRVFEERADCANGRLSGTGVIEVSQEASGTDLLFI